MALLCGLLVEKWQCWHLGGQKGRENSVETWLDSVMQEAVVVDDDDACDGTSVVLIAVMGMERATAVASYCCDDAGLLLPVISHVKGVGLFLDYGPYHQSTVQTIKWVNVKSQLFKLIFYYNIGKNISLLFD